MKMAHLNEHARLTTEGRTAKLCVNTETFESKGRT